MLSAQCLLCLAMGVQWGLFLPKGAFGSKSTTRAAIEDFLVVDTISLVDIDLPMKLKALKLNPPPFCKTSHESSVNANPSYKLWLVPKLSQNNGPGHSEECRSPGTHRVILLSCFLDIFSYQRSSGAIPLQRCVFVQAETCCHNLFQDKAWTAMVLKRSA